MPWAGTLMRADLTSQTYRTEEIPKDVLRKYIGGKGLATWYFTNEVSPDTEPLGPDNVIYMAPGAFSGTTVPASSRFHLVTKSPLTGIYLDCSSGGHFGPEMRSCGIDLLILEGKSTELTGIYLNNHTVKFINAKEFSGLGIYDTEKRAADLIGDKRIHTASIGGAGERMVHYACIGNDFSRNIGRGGAGAVFGSKNLKFVSVKGSTPVIPANPELYPGKVKAVSQWIATNPWVPGTREKGTAGNVDSMSSLGVWPVWNFSGKEFPGAEKINFAALDKKLVRRLSCANCSVSCSKGYRDDVYTGGEIEGPEYETLCLLGPNIGLDDPDGIAALNYMCNQHGIDTISAGAVAGLVFDAVKRGLVEAAVFGFTSEMPLIKQAMHLLELICRREGVGEILANGSRATAEFLHMEGEAPEVKGLDIAGYDPRATTGMSLAYQTSDRGACHLRSFPLGREFSGVLEPGDSMVGKAKFVSEQQNAKAAQECLGICQFPYGIGINHECIAEMLTVCVGHDYSVEDIVTIGERIWNLSRLFNAAAGISRKDDYLPKKISEEPLQYGPTKGRRMTREMQDTMLDEYYQLRGWESNGIPTPERIEKLGLDEAAVKIQGAGK
ncbi:MAG: aldehyde ferredoxin oxidoreductase family protein [Bacteroidetes bacterium]|nr:aldehyde ferredoxin oxidoreductase family protein [Bacteroidota bacterium]